MDPRDRADAVLARAQARGGVVTPDNQASPMDAANTQQIPRRVVDRLDTDPDTTTKLPSSLIEANDVGGGAPGDAPAGADGTANRADGTANPADGTAPAGGDSHFAEPQSTTPLPRPAQERTGPAGAEPDTRPQTQPVSTPGSTGADGGHPGGAAGGDDARAAEQHSHQGELPRQDPGAGTGPDGIDGLVPTVRNEAGQSYLARRLDGL